MNQMVNVFLGLHTSKALSYMPKMRSTFDFHLIQCNPNDNPLYEVAARNDSYPCIVVCPLSFNAHIAVVKRGKVGYCVDPTHMETRQELQAEKLGFKARKKDCKIHDRLGGGWTRS